jgi:hypothetical protein
MTNANEVRVSKGSILDARRLTLLGLNFQATGGEVKLHESVVAGVTTVSELPATYDYITTTASPETLTSEILLWRDVQWAADRNRYGVRSLRLDQTTYTAENFTEYQMQTGQDADSRWDASGVNDAKIGARLSELEVLVVPESERRQMAGLANP